MEAPCTHDLPGVNRFCWQKATVFRLLRFTQERFLHAICFNRICWRRSNILCMQLRLQNFGRGIWKNSHIATLLRILWLTQERLLHAISFNRIVCDRKCFLAACLTENGFQGLVENDFQGLATRKVVFWGLPHGKWFLGTCHSGKWFSRARRTGNGFYGLATQKMALGACHTKNCF